MKRLVARVRAADARRRRSRSRRTSPTGGSTWSRPARPTSAGSRPTATTSRPSTPFPSPHQVRKRLAPRGYALTERLCVYPQYLDPEWMEQGVLDVVKLKYWSFIPRRGSGRRSERDDRSRSSRRARSSAGARGEALSEDELTALFAETRPEVIEEMRAAADELRAELAGRHGDLRRQPQHQLHQRLHRRLRLLRLRPGQALARRLPRRPRTTSRRGSPRRSSSARPRSACRAGSTPTTRSRTTGAGCGSRRRRRRSSTSTPTRRWRSTSCASAPGRSPEQVFDYLLECGLGSTPGTAAEVLDDGVRAADLARTSCRSRAGSRSSRPATAPACARPRR